MAAGAILARGDGAPVRVTANRASAICATRIVSSLDFDLAVEAINRGAMQKSAELAQLIEFIGERRPPRTVLEIGTMAGGTLWLWCQIAYPTAHIISVDLPNGPFGGGYAAEDVPKFLTYTKHQQSMQLFRMDSHDPLTLASVKRYLAIKKRKVDLLFIDGDHTYEGVKQDFGMYGPLVSDDGLIVFHDIVKHTGVPDCDVDVLWDEIKDNHQYREFVTPDGGAAWGGIGVLSA